MAKIIVHSTPSVQLSGISSIISQIMWLLVTSVEGLLFLRFVFRLFDASSSAPFTTLVYSWAQPFVAPFLGIFSPMPVAGTGVIDWSTLLAMLIYSVIASVIIHVFTIASPSSTTSTEVVG